MYARAATCTLPNFWPRKSACILRARRRDTCDHSKAHLFGQTEGDNHGIGTRYGRMLGAMG